MLLEKEWIFYFCFFVVPLSIDEIIISFSTPFLLVKIFLIISPGIIPVWNQREGLQSVCLCLILWGGLNHCSAFKKLKVTWYLWCVSTVWNILVVMCTSVSKQTELKCLKMSRKWAGSSVGITTGYGLEGTGIESQWGRNFPHLSRPALGPTQPPVLTAVMCLVFQMIYLNRLRIIFFHHVLHYCNTRYKILCLA